MGFWSTFWFIWFAAGLAIVQIIAMAYPMVCNDDKKKQMGQTLSKALEIVRQGDFPSTYGVEAAIKISACAIMPMRIIVNFAVIWFVLVPAICWCWSMATAPANIQAIWGLMMRAAVS